MIILPIQQYVWRVKKKRRFSFESYDVQGFKGQFFKCSIFCFCTLDGPDGNEQTRGKQFSLHKTALWFPKPFFRSKTLFLTYVTGPNTVSDFLHRSCLLFVFYSFLLFIGSWRVCDVYLCGEIRALRWNRVRTCVKRVRDARSISLITFVFRRLL